MAQWLSQIPCWGVLLTLGSYLIGVWVYRKTKITLLQPVLISAVVIISFLMIFNIDFRDFNEQNAFLNYMLPITAVVLAIPLYRNINVLKKYWIPIICGVGAGTAATMAVLIILGKIMGVERNLVISMLPKSATNPIAIEVSKVIGGEPSFTVALVVFAGVFGAVCGPELLKLIGVKHPVAKGIAIGTISHAVGTSRAFKEGEIEGSMSSLAMAMAGIFTAVLAPLAATLFF